MTGSSASCAVVGAGPAGLAAALALSRGGAGRVVLFEKGTVGGAIRCAEGVLDPCGCVPLSPGVVKTRVRRAFLRVGGESFTFPLGPRSHFAVVDRAEWQRGLAAQARAGGVEVREGESAEPLALAGSYTWVFDARGRSACPTFRTPAGAFGYGLQWTMEGDFSPWQEALEVEIASAPPGYFWIFPKGKTLAHVGFGRLCAGSGLRDGWDLLRDYVRRRGLAGARVVGKAGGWLPVLPRRPLVADNVFRVGDAGGFGSPLHGGGIDGAWISGEAAAAAALAGQPETFADRADRKIGLLRKVERHLLRGWESRGDEAVLSAARRLERLGPLLRLSLRLLSAPGIGPAVGRAVGRSPRYYAGTD